MFGIALLVDFFFFRIIAILIASLIKFFLERNNKKPFVDHDGDALNALAQIYKVYEAPYSQYQALNNNDDSNNNSQSDSESGLTSNKKSGANMGGLRFFKV